MTESRDYLEMTFRSIKCFREDGSVDATELGKILDVAEKDGVIDQNEIRVLQNIVSKIKPDEINDELKVKLQEIADKIK